MLSRWVFVAFLLATILYLCDLDLAYWLAFLTVVCEEVGSDASVWLTYGAAAIFPAFVLGFWARNRRLKRLSAAKVKVKRVLRQALGQAGEYREKLTKIQPKNDDMVALKKASLIEIADFAGLIQSKLNNLEDINDLATVENESVSPF